MSRNYQENWIKPLLADPSVVLTLESGLLEGLLERLVQHQLDVVLANEAVAAGMDRPLHCRFLGSQAISLVGPASAWKGQTLRIPEDLDGVDIALPGPRHALRAQFDALGFFEVTGSDTGTLYVIRNMSAINVDQLGSDGQCVKKWCFGPEGGLVQGDVLLAQKLALECFESEALALAHHYCLPATR